MSDFDLMFIKNDRQKSLVEKAGKLASRVKQRVKQTDKTGLFSLENLRDLQEENYVTLTLPESYGGENISLYEFLLVQEKLAQGDGSTALSIGWHLGVVKELHEDHLWEEDTFRKFATEIGKNKSIVNRAATEPATGSPARGGIPETRAVRDGDHYVVNGHKSFTTMASVLDYFLVSAYVEEQDTVGWFLIYKDMPGIQIDHTWDTLGMRGTGSDDLILTNVRLPLEMLVETKTNKKPSPKGWLLHIPACYLGIAIAARNDAIHFAKNYQPNSLNTPIAEVPHIKQKIGEIDLELVKARHFMYAVAHKWDTDPDSRAEMGAELAAVKTTATNAANLVVDLAMRIVGGRGLSKQYQFEQYYRDVRAGLHNPPMDDMVIEMLANQALRS
ncbi:acyl-CoA/acyl-ACP dehydrogenase [Aquibacillus sp. 3ASR75-11]|uniref:Acyl-CoA/acyl-ACP dehydrogenase n=1 Tax=Terrihalobacillus insolitus TaxID=2950438 RepID=A0A9X3WNF6_9BACI|nr:acyl-CoA dehydrogenase family protein [Terrihalobacillus insolitus]MDC3412320.1 acyl-CoA/acyl-ACP dehydrogenase [Terrihalobacillus insolitus]MDC3422987.1 acyl-CoA/acyl-ACP dehydrogenase [Terrihalobacillus insolitus]